MRIAYLCSDFGVPVFGSKGASVHVRAMSQALRRLGHEVLVLAARAGGEPPPSFDVAVHEFPLEPFEALTWESLRADSNAGPVVAGEIRSAAYNLALRHRARHMLRQFGPDLIYERYSLFGTAGAGLASDLRVPLVLEVNAPLSNEHAAHRSLHFEALARGLERRVLCSADRLIAVSAEIQRWLVELGVKAERVAVLPNGVDPVVFAAGEREREATRARLGLADRVLVGFLGTLKPWHDTTSLIGAVALLHRRGLPVHLLVMGDGPQRAELRAVARAEGIASAVTFLGAVPHHEVPAHLAALDVAAAPYPATDNFYFSPLKVFEYLAAARPVVAAAVGQIRHCVRHAETGWLYPPGDMGALAEGIGALVEDPERAAMLGQAGREHVCSQHTWERNARAVIELVQPTDRSERAS